MNCPPSTEHRLMDNEHQALLEWAQESARRLRDARPVDETLYALDALRHLARSHFEHECLEMRAMGYPASFAHAQEHQKLLTELSRLRAHILHPNAASDFIESVHDKIAGWMDVHISVDDRLYAKWLQQRRSAPLVSHRISGSGMAGN